jgi:hypothetical protein
VLERLPVIGRYCAAMSQENVEIAKAGFRAWSLLILWAVPVVLFAAAAFELALALGLAGSYSGRLPGQDVEGEETVAAVAYLTMLVGSVVAFVHARYPRVPWAVALFAPAAAAFMTTRFYTYDPYFLPSLQRYSENWTAWAWGWVLGLLTAALVVGVRTRRMPRAGSIATGCILPLLWITSLFMSTGH